MEKFPNIKDGQFVLLFIDRNTGHVLNADLNLQTSETQKSYSVFNSLADTKEFAEQKIKTIDPGNKNVGYYIYDNKEKVIFHNDNL